MNPSWTVRVGRSRLGPARVRTRAHGVDVGQPLDFGAKSEGGSALELLLGALGADLVLRFSERCDRSRIPIDQIEARVEGSLGNALVALGVVGESGDPGLHSATVTLTVASPADPDFLHTLWDETLSRSPLVATLSRAAALTLTLKIV